MACSTGQTLFNVARTFTTWWQCPLMTRFRSDYYTLINVPTVSQKYHPVPRFFFILLWRFLHVYQYDIYSNAEVSLLGWKHRCGDILASFCLWAKNRNVRSHKEKPGGVRSANRCSHRTRKVLFLNMIHGICGGRRIPGRSGTFRVVWLQTEGRVGSS